MSFHRVTKIVLTAKVLEVHLRNEGELVTRTVTVADHVPNCSTTERLPCTRTYFTAGFYVIELTMPSDILTVTLNLTKGTVHHIVHKRLGCGPKTSVSSLYEYCSHNRIGPPVFEVTQSGPAHAPLVTAVVSVVLKNGTRKSECAEANNAKAAKQAAAAQLLTHKLNK